MADAPVYKFVTGEVQKFKDQPVVEEKDAGGTPVREFTIRSANTDALARVTLWPNTAPDIDIQEGAFVAMRVGIRKNGQYINMTAYRIAILNPEENDDSKQTTKPATVRKPKKDAESEVDF